VNARLWECDHCGGPAAWTFFDGLPYYHCELQCDAFMQMELLEEDGVNNIMRGGDAQDAGRLLLRSKGSEGAPHGS